MSAASPIVIATRGSALALAQANAVLAQCRAAFFPDRPGWKKAVFTHAQKAVRAALAAL